MPYVNIKVTREGVTAAQKREIIQRVTQVLYEVLHKDPQLTHIVIDEVELDNWGFGAEQVSELRKQIPTE